MTSKADRTHRSQAGSGKLYVHLASLLRRNIRENIWRPAQKIPPLETLAKDYGVSLATLRQAVILLDEEGLLRRVHGKGTYVTDTAGAREWLRLQTTWDGIQEFYKNTEGMLTNENIFSTENTSIPRGAYVKSAHHLARNYRYMRRRQRLDELPYAVSDVYMDEELFATRPDEFKNNLILKVIGSITPPVAAESYQYLVITHADPAVASSLEVSMGSTVAEIHRTIIDCSGTIIYYAIMYYRGDLIQIESKLK